MSFIEIMLILAAIVAVGVLLEKWVRKKLKISKRNGFLYKRTNKTFAFILPYADHERFLFSQWRYRNQFAGDKRYR
jgi:hypothetical protein